MAALCIANPDGSPRWIWPAASREPVFLSFYPAVTLRQRAFRLAVRIIFLLRIQTFAFKYTQIERPEAAGDGTDWALFTGTVGPNRKQVLIRDRHSVAKIALGPASRRNLDNEHFALRVLGRIREQLPFVFPRLLKGRPDRLIMERLADHGTWDHLTADHLAALRALREGFAATGQVTDWEEWNDIRRRLEELAEATDERIPAGFVGDLNRLWHAEPTAEPVDFGFFHGDFTPWNTLRTSGGKLGIIDWELARDRMPLGFDYFHFHLQQGILVGRRSWDSIYAGIRVGLTPAVNTAVFGSADADTERYLRLYLLFHCSYYLAVYHRQRDWHRQIGWQLAVWSEALTALAPATVDRPAIIRNLKNVLPANGYAVLKLGDQDPADLPADSDLDILVPRSAVGPVIAYLEGSTGVERVRCVRKSFMATLTVVFADGQLLHLDLIWKLKRKAHVFLEAADLIRRARVNAHGVRTVNEADTADYLRLFFGLNGQAVPAKYGIPAGETPPPPARENRGWRGLRNRLDYFLDTLRTARQQRGFIVTFSGVDGAGKSTVIDRVTRMIDKELRRPVKVLRHRPSVLPILSAYVHGKAGAEQRSVERLPRTGTNRNLLSSLVRFAYYYSDYLFGQAYVYVRYVLRGYAVVYDRYYYDFILDARRSNIAVPAWVPRLGLPLLQKPDYNFFLYADAEVILARKQELDRDTIVDLTTRYRGLFDECQDRYPRRVFANVENVELEQTLATLSSTLKTSLRRA